MYLHPCMYIHTYANLLEAWSRIQTTSGDPGVFRYTHTQQSRLCLRRDGAGIGISRNLPSTQGGRAFPSFKLQPRGFGCRASIVHMRGNKMNTSEMKNKTKTNYLKAYFHPQHNHTFLMVLKRSTIIRRKIFDMVVVTKWTLRRWRIKYNDRLRVSCISLHNLKAHVSRALGVVSEPYTQKKKLKTKQGY